MRVGLGAMGGTEVTNLQASLVEEGFAHLARFEREDATHTIVFHDDDTTSNRSVTYGFWSTSPELVDRNTVYATCLDNQWVPESMFSDPEFRGCGLEGDGVSAKRYARQSDETYRGLLHNWQLVVNRASMWNSEVFTRWYGTEGDANYRAFEKLMDEGVFVVYLMNEHGPVRNEDAKRASGFGVAPGSEELMSDGSKDGRK